MRSAHPVEKWALPPKPGRDSKKGVGRKPGSVVDHHSSGQSVTTLL